MLLLLSYVILTAMPRPDQNTSAGHTELARVQPAEAPLGQSLWIFGTY